MAILKHLSSKSTNYKAAVQYLMFEYDKMSNKPLRDEDGNLVMRQSLHIAGINCDPATFDMECRELNQKYHKNQDYSEIKSHHYIISFDPEDSASGKLTGKRAQALGLEYAKRNFPGHQVVVCTHLDGDNHSGNVHVHVIINSLRKYDVERRDYMERPCDSRAGYKHHVTRDYLKYLKRDLMTTCRSHGLGQVDLLKKSRNRRISHKGYFAMQRKGTLPVTQRKTRPTVVPTDPVKEEKLSILAQLENRPSRKTRVASLQHSARAVAYLQEQGYDSLLAFRQDYKSAQTNTIAARKKVKATSRTIDALNAQLHYTGRYFANKKTYQAFLKSKNKGKFKNDHRMAVTEYESARDWLQSHAKDGTLPSYEFLDTPKGKFPSTAKVRELRDGQVEQRNQFRSDYNAARQKERELQTINHDLEALLNTTPVKKRDEQTL